MTRKDYVILANVLRVQQHACGSEDESFAVRAVVESLKRALKADNSAFDAELFHKAIYE